MEHKTVFELNKDSYKELKGTLGLTNPMQTPKLVKMVVSSGFGSVKDKRKIDLISDRLARLTGQKPIIRSTKKAVAGFKTRQGDPIAYQITLRGKTMSQFMDRLINIALPRTKDFRGLPRTAVDDMGNYTIGLKEHTIFAETADEDLKDVFGMGIVLVTSSKNKATTLALLEHLGLPLKREKKEKK
ncbi:MAG: 50S ribosomal protein L5 [Candidatus Taylorbacteria bacterium RIFCSPLOWO2_01_FULL_44_26]|uniref:Large ribosomal subunit protein uL5 n=2 Tax=Candidatus Tayloriibacteriota TaxID=1817919 RepID=A0A1G2ML01_9BACT|nr:MAG: 50S ribosomal protein L5 [Candidatus Taylorbacteria bacterium RIFCSPHIGHO2_02_FULL_44_12]OHA31102.1 MAG: 50S ribosomal protein L5 [Candidatus Taylorbacteria bacterium RIFCSPLOWO2_01_FULL_44_26]